jgi:hypothetical protein
VGVDVGGGSYGVGGCRCGQVTVTALVGVQVGGNELSATASVDLRRARLSVNLWLSLNVVYKRAVEQVSCDDECYVGDRERACVSAECS